MYELKVEIRREDNPRELRRRGWVPAVVYGPGFHQLICLERKELEDLLARCTRSSRISLLLEGERFEAFIKEIQYDPLTDRVIHMDFYRPPEGRPIKMEVPIRLRGEAQARKSGGIVEQAREVVRVRGLSQKIPELIELDISKLDIGQTLHARDVPLPEGIELLTPAEALLVTVLAPRKVEEAAPAEAAAPAEGAAAAPASAPEGAEGATAPQAQAPTAPAEPAKAPKKEKGKPQESK